MAQDDSSNGPGERKPNAAGDADLLRRLGSLDSKLRDVEARKGTVHNADKQKPQMSGIGQAFRLSTEFIAGIIVGGGAGWALDRWAGTRPWGMIVLLLLGTCAGFFNVARAAGLMKSRTDDKSGAK
ncbi:AtpZ/AtpI family protein [Bosea sp. BK604]|uniref:AtpZ/AtpI family protein n=1 Tax=Bosea sp. BK604 TaxID=2512180 RepID=UPI0010509623|nr:AtpZ/AtpI family protein [Bosea sp. BK604]TCR61089.1 ATP synthase protein I [Bosea sp. BK604]